MFELYPNQLPEPLPADITEYLKFSDDVLRRTGVEEFLTTDYLIKKHYFERQMDSYSRDLFSALRDDPSLKLDDVEVFYNSKLPLALMFNKQGRYTVVDLVKVDDFGQAYPNYSINLFSYDALAPGDILASFEGYQVSKPLYYAAMTLIEKQQQLAWNPTFGPSDSSV